MDGKEEEEKRKKKKLEKEERERSKGKKQTLLDPDGLPLYDITGPQKQNSREKE